MKIIATHQLTDGNIAYQLEFWPSTTEKELFKQWCRDNNIDEFVMIKMFYSSDMYGDIDHPAIQVIGYCPEEIKSLILLRWS